MQQRLERASLAASRMLSLETEVKNSALACIAQGLRENRDKIFYANQLDLTAARQNGLAIPLLRRLEFDKKNWMTFFWAFGIFLHCQILQEKFWKRAFWMMA